MKHLSLFTLLFFVFTMTYAQERPDYDNLKKAEIEQHLSKEGFISKTGWVLKEGEEITLGNGTMPNKFFAFIYETPAYQHSDERERLTSFSNGKKAKVKSLLVRGSKRTGYQVIARIGIGTLTNYWVELDNAIEAGEVTLPEPYASHLQTPVAKPFSVADEIRKFKELMDEGVLTKEEFETQKKKLLNQ
ncbi:MULTISPECIES: SHOCT domain-containing protein [unclassified Siphonobacter]|uniref:SHOCT domain-containing protein n=1 Tax=unclassified Siphonobacter TaxID=2635712 RepID=UPI0018E363F4|nr:MULTISPECIES: SHOCT domain-containing protein [unclassified Siphonobacter]MDQ1090197.1 hypothetical protein [Siphonobacter sp. SORGH_AS_1065]